jgi:hypothetical protein
VTQHAEIFSLNFDSIIYHSFQLNIIRVEVLSSTCETCYSIYWNELIAIFYRDFGNLTKLLFNFGFGSFVW